MLAFRPTAVCVVSFFLVSASSLSPSSNAVAQSANYPNAATDKMLRVTYPQSGSAAAADRETVTAGPLDDFGGNTNVPATAAEPSDVMLQKEIDSLDAEREILKVQLGDSHPSIQVFDARIKAAEKALASVRRRSAEGTDAEGKMDGESFPAAAAAITDAETQASIEQLQRVVRILAERVIALETEVAKLKQR